MTFCAKLILNHSHAFCCPPTIGKGNAPEEEKEEPSQDKSANEAKVEFKSYGFHVIDQNERRNILLAEMVKGQLYIKQSAKVGTLKSYTTLIFDEIDARVKELSEMDSQDATVKEFKKAKKDIKLYLNTVKKSARASKNILRVLVRTSSFPLFFVWLLNGTCTKYTFVSIL